MHIRPETVTRKEFAGRAEERAVKRKGEWGGNPESLLIKKKIKEARGPDLVGKRDKKRGF